MIQAGTVDECSAGPTVDRAHDRPSSRIWFLAAAELVAATAIAALALRGCEHVPPWDDVGHGSLHPPLHEVGPADWGVLESTLLALALAAFGRWVVSRGAIAAFLAAGGLVAVVTSSAVRTLATQSHIIAMVAVELVLVVAPLLVVSALRFRPRLPSVVCTVATVASGVLYAAVMIAIHIPGVHTRVMELGRLPLWSALSAGLVGLLYWVSVLGTAGVVRTRTRRAVLLATQEVGAFIGLLSLFGAWEAAHHQEPFGLSSSWDQRLGGLVMIVTCAAVVVPIAMRMRDESPKSRPRHRNPLRCNLTGRSIYLVEREP